MSHHPIQPLETDENGVLRFKKNRIVDYLLRHGTTDMNDLASMDFSQEDQEQFAQLIGYSVRGAGELHYFRDETIEAALLMHEELKSESAARMAFIEEQLRKVSKHVKDAAVELFSIHPDDLQPK